MDFGLSHARDGEDNGVGFVETFKVYCQHKTNFSLRRSNLAGYNQLYLVRAHVMAPETWNANFVWLIGSSLTSREHARGCMRRSYKGHEMGCLWLLLPKPKTGSDYREEQEPHRHAEVSPEIRNILHTQKNTSPNRIRLLATLIL